jgi:hypothetical protein
MAIIDYMTDTVDIHRLADVTGGEEMQVLYIGVGCAIQQERPESATQEDGYMYNRYNIYFRSSQDIQTGDKVIDGSNEYRVRGTTEMKLGGTLNHTIAVMVKDNDYA